MCEHCKKNDKKDNTAMTYSYYRKEEGESESVSRVSPTMNKEEFRLCLSQMLLSMRIHAENIYKMTEEEFKDIVGVTQTGSYDPVSTTNCSNVSYAKNPQLYN